MTFDLQVQPFAGIVSEVSQSTPRLLINREVVGPFSSPWKGRRNDVVLKGDIVTGIKRLVKLLEWTEVMDAIVTEESDNWKNKKEAERMASEKEKTELVETNLKMTKPNGPNRTRNFHTVTGNSTQNPTSRLQVLFPGTTAQANEQFEVKKHFNANGTLPGNGVSSPGNTNKTNFKQSLFACNSVARRTPLLPFRYTHRPGAEMSGNFKSIDPSRDLASAGFGLGDGSKDTSDVKFYVESSSDSDSSSSDDSEDSEG